MNVLKHTDVAEMQSYKMPLFPFRALMLEKCHKAMVADWTTALIVINFLEDIKTMADKEERQIPLLDYIVCCEVTESNGKQHCRYWYEL